MADAPMEQPHGDPLLPPAPASPAAGAAPHAGAGWRALLTPSLMTTAAVIVLLDQVTKAMVAASLPMYESITLVPGLVDLT
ncbi:MAG: hypothetical protein M3R55_12490, partial [Acidobacteriota bacterium]|nr:hypothetical protein [Acidobacteriota bacterium]